MAQKRNQRPIGKPHQRPQKHTSGYNYYNNSSVAYDYALPDYDNEPQRQKVRKANPKRGSAPAYIRVKSTRKKLSFTTYLMVGVFFACAFFAISAISKNTYQKGRNIELTSELRVLNARTNEIRLEVANSMDLALIENIARTRLMMREPAPHQIVEISVPRQNYTVFNQLDEFDIEISAESGVSLFSLSGIFNMFRD